MKEMRRCLIFIEPKQTTTKTHTKQETKKISNTDPTEKLSVNPCSLKGSAVQGSAVPVSYKMYPLLLIQSSSEMSCL
jgi:hypothetical protein